MSILLTEAQLRTLGVLIEKSLAHVEGYPLTLNALLLGANQRQNRDPVAQYGESDISQALRALIHLELVAQAPPPHGARAVRFEHRVVDVFHWDRREQAIMAELMLRGPQTAGELRTRASRMTPLTDLEAARTILKVLADGDPPFVEELPREPGRAANRFRHLLSADAREPTDRSLPPTVRAAGFSLREGSRGLKPAAQPVRDEQSGSEGRSDNVETEGSLADRVLKLEGRVTDLARAVAGLERKIAGSGDERGTTGV